MIKSLISSVFPVLLLCSFLPSRTLAYNNTSLKWHTISTDHFEVHYHQGAEWTAEQVARVAEEIHPLINNVYDYEPKGKIHFVVKDTDDYANGATYYYDNKIEIWATNLDFGFRGTSQWIRNVVTHEYTHMISLQAGFKFGGRIPAFYLQLIDFERERRPDVLTGYPSNLASYPIPGSIIAPWFAEGIAQFQSPTRHYDCWDTHRDMILRCAVLEDKMLSYDEMGFFGHSGMGNEEVYDHGYGLVSYIASKYGSQALGGIIKAMRSPLHFKMDGALKKVTGKTGEELYEGWKSELKSRYLEQASEIMKNPCEGKVLVKGGYMTIAPSWSSDGKKIVYLSNDGSDFSGTSLYIIDKQGGSPKGIKGGVSSRAYFSSDGSRIVYSKKHKVDRYGSKVSDIFIYDFSSKKETRISFRLRANSPSFSPKDSQIVCVLNSDGTHKLAVMSDDGKNLRVIFSQGKGVQLYSPQYSPDGSTILFGIFNSATRDIAAISSEGGDFRCVVKGPYDERDARWKIDGSGIIFSSDRSGVFNLYQLDFGRSEVKQLTNVIGGAFMADTSPVGNELVYSGFTAEGYGIKILSPENGKLPSMSLLSYENEGQVYEACAFLRNPAESSENGTQGDDAGEIMESSGKRGVDAAIRETDPSSQAFKKGNYRPSFTPFQFFPRFIAYDRTARVGLVCVSNEMLDKQSIFLSGSIGFNKEFDVYLSYEMRYLYPTFFAEFIRLRELFSDQVRSQTGIGSYEIWDLDLTYNLWEFDIGLRFELEDIYSITKRNNFSLFYTHGEYSVRIEANYFDSKDSRWHFGGVGGWEYYISNEITARYNYKSISKATDSDINPRGGREVNVEYVRSFDKLFTSGEFEYGFKPKFDKDYFNRCSIRWKEYVALPYLRHTLELKLFASAIDRKVDDFFYIYIGGRDYLRGYTYYAIGGRKAFIGSITYRFPILRAINRQFLHLYLRDIYGSLFYEAGNAWNEDKIRTFGYKKTVGGELRIGMGSFYIFPTSFSIVSAYAITPFNVEIPVFGEEAPVIISNGKKWSTYVTLGFGF